MLKANGEYPEFEKTSVALKSCPETASIPVVIVAAHADPLSLKY
jgi:hypothetical protein